MPKICLITSKKKMHGHKVSHANNKTLRTFDINLQKKRFWSEKYGRYIRIAVATRAIRIIDKCGIDAFQEKIRVNVLRKKRKI